MQIKIKFDFSRIIIIFGVGFLIGCLYMNILWKFGGFFNMNERIYAIDLLYGQESYQCFWELAITIITAILYVLTLISGFTVLGNVFAQGILFVMGIWWGAFLTECMMVKGISFIWQIFKIIMPDNIIYLTAFVFCMIWNYNMSTSLRSFSKHNSKKTVKSMGVLAISIFFFIIWAISNFYVNYIKSGIL